MSKYDTFIPWTVTQFLKDFNRNLTFAATYLTPEEIMLSEISPSPSHTNTAVGA